MNLGEIHRKVRKRLDEESQAFFSDEDILASIQEGYEEMADASGFFERWAMVKMLKGRTYYDLSQILPRSFLAVSRVFNPNTNKWLDPVTDRDLDYKTLPQWELTDGTPEKYLVRGVWWLGVFPHERQDTPGLRVYHIGLAPPLREPTDVPQFPQEFHEGLVTFAISDCLAQQRETKKALKYWASYSVYEGQLTDYVDRRVLVARKSVL